MIWTPHRTETGYCTNWFKSTPKLQRVFDWVYACWNTFGSVATARHPHAGKICVLSFSNRTRPKHFSETDNCGLADLRSAVELVLHVGPKWLQPYFPLRQGRVCVCVCVCVLSVSSTQPPCYKYSFAPERKPDSGTSLRWSSGYFRVVWTEKHTCQFPLHIVAAFCIAEFCLIYEHIINFLGWCNINATSKVPCVDPSSRVWGFLLQLGSLL